MKKIVFLLTGFILCAGIYANNLQITGTSVTADEISFQISWDNSWNTDLAPNNWDAVWVFVKYQDCATRVWYHASLSTVSGDHSVGGGVLQVDAVPDGKGVFVRRSAVGGGNISSSTVTLKMTIPSGTYNYKVFGIEMVNIPKGSFQIGDGASASTFLSITIDSTYEADGVASAVIGGSSATVPAAFPLGWNAFYCMKYEITQEQYVEFLNTLTYDQQVTRTAVDPISAAGTFAFGNSGYYRNRIKIMTSGNNNVLPAVYGCDFDNNGVCNETTDGQNIPCSYLKWADFAAYLDWAALRPMSETEYEKVCRGPQARVAGEFAWGTTEFSARGVVYAGFTNSGLTNEMFTTVNNGASVMNNPSNASYGPCRTGISATGTSGRASSGASYYGAMEMTGNLAEQVITVRSTNSGAAYTGNTGDGSLSNLGEANQTSWPGTNGTGSCVKGGDWYNWTTVYAPVSYRGTTTTVGARDQDTGGRGVR